MESKSCCYGSYLLSSQLNWDGTCWQPRMKAVGLKCLVFINKAIYMKNKRTSLESIEEVTVMWEPTPSQDPFFFFFFPSYPYLKIYPSISFISDIMLQTYAPSSHPTKIKYFGSVGNIQVKCYLNFLYRVAEMSTALGRCCKQEGQLKYHHSSQKKKKKVNVYPV